MITKQTKEISKTREILVRNSQRESNIMIGNTVLTSLNEGDDGMVQCQIIAGPCSVESEDQLMRIAKSVKASGATMLRGGAFKPRTSPYSFQGLEEAGIQILLNAKEETGLPIVTELVSIRHIDAFEDVDVIQIGARNMYNYDLLREVGKTQKPVLLKRGLSATIEEWLMAAEYIMSEGNMNVALCERGIRSFDSETRNVLDLGAVALLKTMTHLPIVVDPSHGTGRKEIIGTMAHASMAIGANGIVIEVHDQPELALSDGGQSLDLEEFDRLMTRLNQRRILESQLLSK